MKFLLVIIFLSVIPLLVSSTVLSSYAQTVSKGQITIDKAITKSTSWDSICDVGITTGFNQSLVNVYHKDVNRCNGNVTNPTPVPTPTTDKTTVCLVGDLKGSTVPNMMKNCNYKIGLGDLGYASDLSYFKGLKFDRCVVGNHDSTEDGSSAIYKEALAYCGDHWSLKIANNQVILFGINTNGDMQSQLSAISSMISSSSIMTGIKSIILVSHKGGHVPPNSHHPAEAASLYSQLEKLVPANIKLIEVFGHNHVSSAAPSQNWYQAGAGGKSFYTCGTDSIWTFCDNKSLSYLELTIGNKDGATAAKFIN